MRKFIRTIVVPFLLGAAFGLLFLALTGCSTATRVNQVLNGWPESVEFSQLEGGQTRFSSHGSGIDGMAVVVDHRTGVQYLVTADGVCPLLDVDGTPLLVAEAGE